MDCLDLLSPVFSFVCLIYLLFFLAFTLNSTLVACNYFFLTLAFVLHMNNKDLFIYSFLLARVFCATSSGTCHKLKAGRAATMSLPEHLAQLCAGEGKKPEGEESQQQVSDTPSPVILLLSISLWILMSVFSAESNKAPVFN